MRSSLRFLVYIARTHARTHICTEHRLNPRPRICLCLCCERNKPPTLPHLAIFTRHRLRFPLSFATFIVPLPFQSEPHTHFASGIEKKKSSLLLPSLHPRPLYLLARTSSSTSCVPLVHQSTFVAGQIASHPFLVLYLTGIPS
ncbi:hypothetical protein BCV70DRAFT_12765 [Testicularia cyperi]|uniref:Uncharacterized protein n=1 Tax=Testicularia cyperi TaxID=1882483 RepID=A0A317XY19_9BASI|nr:hypothetical protein BCV70DRAFT_12765 [Testicularia cyperi]